MSLEEYGLGDSGFRERCTHALYFAVAPGWVANARYARCSFRHGHDGAHRGPLEGGAAVQLDEMNPDFVETVPGGASVVVVSWEAGT